jgi:hypothetical protein
MASDFDGFYGTTWQTENGKSKNGLDSSDSRLYPVVGCCEHGNELSDSIKDGVAS